MDKNKQLTSIQVSKERLANISVPTSNVVSVSDNQISQVNTGGGHFVVGNFQAPEPSKIASLIQASKAFAEDSIEYQMLLDDLENYHKPRPGREIVGLENKLTNAKMTSLIDDAKYLKNRAITKVARYQLQSHNVAVNNYIYGKINETFNADILPLIKSGKSAHEINKFISSMIIHPLTDEICEADPTINHDTIRGMLYILTGNCHLTWK